MYGGYVYEFETQLPYHERLSALWGMTVYSTAGTTGMLTGMYYSLRRQTAVVGGLLFTLCSIPLYPQTASLLF
jgi:hypothetical protein